MQLDLAKVDAILDRYPSDESSLVMVLQDVQTQFHFLPSEALERVADRLDLPRSKVFSVATFYKVFSLSPKGRTVIQVCKGTACHVRGAQLLEDELSRQLRIHVGETTQDGAFTLETVNCVGACAMAPVVIAGGRYHAEVVPSKLRGLVKKASASTAQPPQERAREHSTPRFASPAELLARSAVLREKLDAIPTKVVVCGGPGCLAAGAREVLDAIHMAAVEANVPVKAEIGACTHHDTLLSLSGCQGLCQQGPLVHVLPDDVQYVKVKAKDAKAIVEAVSSHTVAEPLLGEARGRADHPFYRGQALRALSTCGQVDPDSLDHYLALDGFAALAKTMAQLEPEQVLDAVDSSGLRGRGGAGFPTGRKWRSAIAAAKASGRPPYVLCNGDEGDPGAFMDRAIMEGSPFQVIEGMILGAYALRAHEGYIYVRAEYPLAVERLERAIRVCTEAGLLGDGILGSGLSFHIRISRGGGAFVCGESTALMRSIEGKVGEPRAKYTRSVERGLHDAPTVLNNVETWALVPGIVRDGAEAFAALGTKRSKGTKAFSLTGQVRRTGLVEVPMGTTLRQLIFEIGGGVPPGRTFKAVQTGGPSGGCLPESQLDLPVDFDALTDAGSMMGSGGMIVLDDTSCMVDVARYFVRFLLEESCGKCVPCRLGLPQLAFLLTKLTEGNGTLEDIDTIEAIASTMEGNSLCGLGKSAPNPVLSTLRYFRHEYEAHVKGRCPAGVCRALIRYEVTDACTGCLACIKPCPETAITGELETAHLIDQNLCTRCGICRSVCNFDAIRVVSGGEP